MLGYYGLIQGSKFDDIEEVVANGLDKSFYLITFARSTLDSYNLHHGVFISSDGRCLGTKHNTNVYPFSFR